MPAAKPAADAAQRVKPSVGILYSDDVRHSAESKNLAYYMAAMLATSGYSIIYLVGSSGSSDGLGRFVGRLHYCPPGYAITKPVEAPTADITHEQWNILPKCDLLIVTVNSNEVTQSMEKLADVLKGVKRLAVLSLQRGVKNSAIVKDELSGKVPGAVVLEAVVGFGVVTSTLMHNKAYPPSAPVYLPTVASSSVSCGLERISKENFDVLDGPMRLLEVLPEMHFYYRKTLTPMSWGVVIFESLYAVNMLTGGSLLQTVRCREARVLFASMLREARLALHVAARGGAWRPDISLSVTTAAFMFVPGLSTAGDGQLWLLEMMLLLPNWLWVLSGLDWWYINIPRGGSAPVAEANSAAALHSARSSRSTESSSNIVVSPGQCDWLQGRACMADKHLGELVASGERHSHDMHVCKAVLAAVRRLEKGAVGGNNGSSSAIASEHALPFSTAELAAIAKELRKDTVKVTTNENTKATPVSATTTRDPIVLGKDSFRELLYYGSRAFAVLVLVVMLLYALLNFTYDDGEPEPGEVLQQGAVGGM